MKLSDALKTIREAADGDLRNTLADMSPIGRVVLLQDLRAVVGMLSEEAVRLSTRARKTARVRGEAR